MPGGGDARNSLGRMELLRFFRGFSLVFAVAFAIAALFFFMQNTDSSSIKPSENSETFTIESISYGFTADNAQPNVPVEPAGESCFIKLKDVKKPLSQAPFVCFDLTEGQEVSAFVSGNDIRINPDETPLMITGYSFAMTAASLLSIGSILCYFVTNRKIKNTWKITIERILEEDA